MEKLWLVIFFCISCVCGKAEIGVDDLKFKFKFYSRNHANGIQLTPNNSVQLTAVGFRGSLPTKFIVHGFLNNQNSTWIKRITKEILEIEEANVIIFDWSSCAKNLLYIEVVDCVKVTSRYLGSFIKFLEKDGDLDLEKTHLIGHSLGAQVSGLAMSVYPPKTVGRITGLDPAGPLFEDADITERLNPSRAKIVDVIHTCVYFLGMKIPVGTLDFYPNGGFNQPSCAFFDLGCQHKQSHEYFIDSLKNRNKFVAQKCESLGQALSQKCTGVSGTMNYFIEKSLPGIYHLKVK